MENDMVSVELDYEMWCSFLKDTNIPPEKYTQNTKSHNLIRVEFINREDAALCIEYTGNFDPEEKLSPLAPVPDAWTPETLPDMTLSEIVHIAGGKTARKKELDAQLKDVKSDIEILNFHILKKLRETNYQQSKKSDEISFFQNQFNSFKFQLSKLDFLFISCYFFKKGTVVQLVRAPPCHGGSCGFESRQSR